jgi:hypothetical protein
MIGSTLIAYPVGERGVFLWIYCVAVLRSKEYATLFEILELQEQKKHKKLKYHDTKLFRFNKCPNFFEPSAQLQ